MRTVPLPLSLVEPMWAIAVAVLIVAIGGCSSAAMPSPHTIATTDRSCTTSRAAPALDTVVAAAGGIVAVAGVLVIARTAADDDVDHPAVPYGAGGLSVGVGAVAATFWGLSARHGFRSARACERRSR